MCKPEARVLLQPRCAAARPRASSEEAGRCRAVGEAGADPDAGKPWREALLCHLMLGLAQVPRPQFPRC